MEQNSSQSPSSFVAAMNVTTKIKMLTDARQHIESTSLHSVVSIDEAGHESTVVDSVVDVNGLEQTPSSA